MAEPDDVFEYADEPCLEDQFAWDEDRRWVISADYYCPRRLRRSDSNGVPYAYWVGFHTDRDGFMRARKEFEHIPGNLPPRTLSVKETGMYMLKLLLEKADNLRKAQVECEELRKSVEKLQEELSDMRKQRSAT